MLIIFNPFFTTNYISSWPAIIYICIAAVAFSLGYDTQKTLQHSNPEDHSHFDIKLEYSRFSIGLMAVAALGCIMRTYQILVMRGLSAFEDVTVQRYTAMQKGIQGGLFSALVLALAGIYIPAAILHIFSPNKSRLSTYLFVAVTALYLFICYLSGGRNGIVIVFLILILAFIRASSFKLSAKFLFYGSFAGALIFAYILYTFNVREQVVRARGPNKGISNMVLYNDIIFNYDLLKSAESPSISRAVVGLATTASYVTHSLAELSLVVGNEDKLDRSFSGYNTTFPLNLFIEKATGLNFEKASFSFRDGRYKTLYSALIFDFGLIFSLALIFFWGFFSSFLDYSYRSNITLSPAYILNLLLILFSPIYNLVSTSNMLPSFAWAALIPGVFYVIKKKLYKTHIHSR